MKNQYSSLANDIKSLKSENVAIKGERDRVKAELDMLRENLDSQQNERNHSRRVQNILQTTGSNFSRGDNLGNKIFYKDEFLGQYGRLDKQTIFFEEESPRPNSRFTKFSSQPIKIYSKNGEHPPSNKTLIFEGTSNFVPLEVLEKGHQKLTMSKLADIRFSSEYNIAKDSPVPKRKKNNLKKKKDFFYDDVFEMSGSREMQHVLNNRPYSQQTSKFFGRTIEEPTSNRIKKTYLARIGGSTLKRDPEVADSIEEILKKYGDVDLKLDSTIKTVKAEHDNSINFGKYSRRNRPEPIMEDLGEGEGENIQFGTNYRLKNTSNFDFGAEVGIERNSRLKNKETEQSMVSKDFGTTYGVRDTVDLGNIMNKNEERLKQLEGFDRKEDTGKFTYSKDSNDFSKLDELLKNYAN